MKTHFQISRIFLILMGLSALNIALQALADPQTVMNFVDVELGNITARNSIRALYGGVNLAFALFWLYAAFRAQREGLILGTLYTGGFVLGRLLSIALDGMPGAFALQWLVVESVCAIGSVVLLALLPRLQRDARGGSMHSVSSTVA
ncbi:MAG: DUF4345 domain-containing protein [Thermoanaerobaculia bacterium]|nr:DUF4345 domain-containing protein [Thermoanaerobaculia bacterium]